MSEDPTPRDVATVTHARIRAAQGDVAGARLILETVLSREPGNSEARALLESLPARRTKLEREGAKEALPPAERDDLRMLPADFREAPGAPEEDRKETARRLRDLLERLQARGGPSDA